MEANVYGQADGTYAGKKVSFSGTVPSYTLLSGSGNWTVKAFVRDFAADFSTFSYAEVPITSTGTFSVSLDAIDDPTRHVQWGLQTTGPAVWITELPSKGSVVVNAVPTAAEGGLIDVGNGVVNAATGLSVAEMFAAIVRGRGDGSWNGTTGITSSAAAADGAAGAPRAIGWLDNGDGSVTFAFAAPGDSNLDWAVDILDAANFFAGAKYDSGEPASWIQGDFTYDGLVDILDASEFFSSGLFDAGVYNGPSPSIAAVPEPSVWPLLATGVGLMAAVRGRRARVKVRSGFTLVELLSRRRFRPGASRRIPRSRTTPRGASRTGPRSKASAGRSRSSPTWTVATSTRSPPRPRLPAALCRRTSARHDGAPRPTSTPTAPAWPSRASAPRSRTG